MWDLHNFPFICLVSMCLQTFSQLWQWKLSSAEWCCIVWYICIVTLMCLFV